MLNFLQPDKFDNSDTFQEAYGDMKEASQLEKLHEELKPFMLRRMKEDVEKSLKPKEETVINVELTAMQKKFYRAVYDHNTSVLYVMIISSYIDLSSSLSSSLSLLLSSLL